MNSETSAVPPAAMWSARVSEKKQVFHVFHRRKRGLFPHVPEVTRCDGDKP